MMYAPTIPKRTAVREFAGKKGITEVVTILKKESTNSNHQNAGP
jgi:hypothetical protein